MTRRTSSRRGHGGLPGERGVSCVWGKEKEENKCVKKILVSMCGNVLFMKKMCANKSMEVSYV
jgi:hypothetical protein